MHCMQYDIEKWHNTTHFNDHTLSPVSTTSLLINLSHLWWVLLGWVTVIIYKNWCGDGIPDTIIRQSFVLCGITAGAHVDQMFSHVPRVIECMDGDDNTDESEDEVDFDEFDD